MINERKPQSGNERVRNKEMNEGKIKNKIKKINVP